MKANAHNLIVLLLSASTWKHCGNIVKENNKILFSKEIFDLIQHYCKTLSSLQKQNENLPLYNELETLSEFLKLCKGEGISKTIMLFYSYKKTSIPEVFLKNYQRTHQVSEIIENLLIRPKLETITTILQDTELVTSPAFISICSDINSQARFKAFDRSSSIVEKLMTELLTFSKQHIRTTT